MKCPHCEATIFYGKKVIQEWNISCWNRLECPNCLKEFSYSYSRGYSKMVLK